MIRKIVTLILLISVGLVYAQSGTISPYSFAGLGEINFRGTQINRFMGGLEVYNDSIHANLTNPSSYAKLKLTNYTLGLNYSINNLKDASASKSIASASLDYIGVALPTRHFGFGFGIIPYTSVGYKISHAENDADDNIEVLNVFQGDGGVNKAFFSVGFNILKFLSLGATFNYNFGQITQETGTYQNEIVLGTILENQSSISGYDLKFSAHFELPLSEVLEFQALFSFAPQANLTSTNSRNFLTRSFSEQIGFGQVIEIDLTDIGLDKTNVKIPSVISFGTGVGKEREWFLGGQYTINAMGDFSNRFMNFSNVDYQNGYQISLGGFYIPDFSSITSYWKRIVFRMGFRHQLTGVVINNFGIKETGINFGFGLPLAGFSNANIGFEYGNRGTGINNLYKENFWSFRIGFSLNDRWFVKRKYN